MYVTLTHKTTGECQTRLVCDGCKKESRPTPGAGDGVEAAVKAAAKGWTHTLADALTATGRRRGGTYSERNRCPKCSREHARATGREMLAAWLMSVDKAGRPSKAEAKATLAAAWRDAQAIAYRRVKDRCARLRRELLAQAAATKVPDEKVRLTNEARICGYMSVLIAELEADR